MSRQYAVPRLVQPSKRRPFRAVVLETDTSFLFSTETNSLPVVSSSFCIQFSIDCSTLLFSLVKRPDFSKGFIVPCKSICRLIHSPHSLSAGDYSFLFQDIRNVLGSSTTCRRT